MSSLRASILSADDIIRERVEVPEWGVTVEVRSMTGAERMRILDLALADGDGDGMDLSMFYPEVVIASCFDPETGEQVFTSEDRDALTQKNANALDRVGKVGMRLGGFDSGTADAVGKGSTSAPTDGSSSD